MSLSILYHNVALTARPQFAQTYAIQLKRMSFSLHPTQTLKPQLNNPEPLNPKALEPPEHPEHRWRGGI